MDMFRDVRFVILEPAKVHSFDSSTVPHAFRNAAFIINV